MSLSDDQFKELHKQLKSKSGGFSVNVATGESPQEGYMVSLPGSESSVRSLHVSPAHIKEYVDRHGAALAQDERYLGGWNNKNARPRMSYFDVSRNVAPTPANVAAYGKDTAMADARTSAMDLSVAYGQEAIYDLQKGESVYNKDFDPKRRNPNA